jgi:S1-C subfamily serine protease
MAGRLDLPAVAGVLVADVNDHSGAEQAGIQVGDVILSVEGTETGSIPQLLERVSRFRPGQTASVQVWRDGGVLSFEVELGRRDGLLPDAPEGTGDSDEDAAASVFGCLVKPAQDGLEGVLVLKVGPGPFRNAGVTKGMVITAVDNTPVQGVEDLIHALEQAGQSGQRGILLEGLDSNGAPLWFGVNPG